MTLHLVTPPAVLPVSLHQVKAHLEIDESDTHWDALLAGYIRTAVASIDGRDGWLGRALCTQTWDLKLDGFPSCIRVPLPPLQSVGSITYVDQDGATQTLSSALYQVVGAGGSIRPYIIPAYNQTWPAVRWQPEAVTVRFTAGYLDTNSPADTVNGVPEAARLAVMMLAGDWYANRESYVVGSVANVLPTAVEYLLRPLQVSAL